MYLYFTSWAVQLCSGFLLSSLSLCVFEFLSLYLSVALSLCRSISLSLYLSVALSLCCSISLSIYLYVSPLYFFISLLGISFYLNSLSFSSSPSLFPCFFCQAIKVPQKSVEQLRFEQMDFEKLTPSQENNIVEYCHSFNKRL